MPHEEHDEAKALGAAFDGDTTRWYVSTFRFRTIPNAFQRWRMSDKECKGVEDYDHGDNGDQGDEEEDDNDDEKEYGKEIVPCIINPLTHKEEEKKDKKKEEVYEQGSDDVKARSFDDEKDASTSGVATSSKNNAYLECVVCKEAPKNTLLLPCNHVAVCADITKKLMKSSRPRCPMCQSRKTKSSLHSRTHLRTHAHS